MQPMYDLIYAIWPWAALAAFAAGWFLTVDKDMERPASPIRATSRRR